MTHRQFARRFPDRARATRSGIIVPGRPVPGEAHEDKSGQVVRRTPMVTPNDRRPTAIAMRAGAKLRGHPRLIKWIGDPPVVNEDGWSVSDWTYENNRVIALYGHHSRLIEKGTVALDGRRLSRTYLWGLDNLTGIIEMDPEDASMLLANSPTHEWVDVTDEPKPHLVCHKPIIRRGKSR